MSQLFRIQLKTTVSRDISASDSVSYPLELTEILPQSEMLDLFKQSLLNKGWRQEEDGRLSNTGSVGETLVIDLESKTLVARLDSEKNVSTEVSIDQTVDAWEKEEAQSYGKSLLDEKVQGVENKLDNESNQLQQSLTQQLIDSEQQRMQLINEAVQDVYRDALTRKAGQLGEIVSVDESTNSSGEYELVIKVTQ
ncbi:hypothetical protein MNBD_GAMMA12-3886 [hydrothermal vent metagenome]|uniref:FtsH ternary system domain-containing protein n=1 Tax=hydrothermal vent metagenome TaxID=652676 RepID=A0A3B0YB29_9ZZZZ